MSKVKLVIEIDEEVKEAFDKGDINFCYYDYNSVIGKAIRNGTPLPEDFSLEDYERYKKDSESLSWMKYPDRMGN